MTFKDNFSEMHMLFSQPVHFSLYENGNTHIPFYEFEMGLPTMQHISFNEDFKLFVSFIHSDIVDLQKQFVVVRNFESHYQLMCGLALLNNSILNLYLQRIIKGLQVLNVNISFNQNDVPGTIYIDNYLATEELITRMFRIILISLALKKESDFIDDPQMRAYQEKINRIKKQNKATINGDVNFQQAFLILTYEFGYKPNEILEMTQYAVNLILSYTGKSIQYKLSLIAAGNGNSKKVKFITDKGK